MDIEMTTTRIPDFAEIQRQVLDEPLHFVRAATPEEECSRLACMNLHYASFAYTDFGRAYDQLPLYAEDFNGVTDGVVMDYEAKRAALRKRQENIGRKTRHVCSNYLFRMSDARTAYALSIVTLYLEDDCKRVGVTPLTVADCGEKYVRGADGAWRIQFRYLQPAAGAPR